jgi:hypothetical protein
MTALTYALALLHKAIARAHRIMCPLPGCTSTFDAHVDDIHDIFGDDVLEDIRAEKRQHDALVTAFRGRIDQLDAVVEDWANELRGGSS